MCSEYRRIETVSSPIPSALGVVSLSVTFFFIPLDENVLFNQQILAILMWIPGRYESLLVPMWSRVMDCRRSGSCSALL